MPKIIRAVEKLAQVTANVAKQVRDELAQKGSATVVVSVAGGHVQSIVTDRMVEVYVVEYDVDATASETGRTTEIGGLPVKVSKQEPPVIPAFVNKVATAHDRGMEES